MSRRPKSLKELCELKRKLQCTSPPQVSTPRRPTTYIRWNTWKSRRGPQTRNAMEESIWQKWIRTDPTRKKPKAFLTSSNRPHSIHNRPTVWPITLPRWYRIQWEIPQRENRPHRARSRRRRLCIAGRTSAQNRWPNQNIRRNPAWRSNIRFQEIEREYEHRRTTPRAL